MRYFKDNSTPPEVYGYTQEQIDLGLVRLGLTELTEAELEEHSRIATVLDISPVTPRQIRQALTALGLRQKVEDAVKAAGQDYQDWWEYATSFEIDHPAVLAVANAIGEGQAKLNELFTLASKL